MHRTLALLPLALLGACASTAPQSGFLSSYDGVTPREGGVRTAAADRRDEAALATVRTVRIEPTRFAPTARVEWMSEGERTLLLREVDAQLCFELTERFALAADGAPADASVRTGVVAVTPTGRAASALSAAAGFMIPGPLGLRVPGTVGALAAETEMLDPAGRQIAALSWNRAAQPVGTDSPSLSRVGDALQFVEPFADDAGRVMTPPGVRARTPPAPDPCAEYGPRMRPEGFLTRVVTGLYAPETAAARPEPAADPVKR